MCIRENRERRRKDKEEEQKKVKVKSNVKNITVKHLYLSFENYIRD